MSELDPRLLEAQAQFVSQWGRMSSSWGINRTMAQIHALLLCTDEAFTMEEIIQRLQISRGNASMNLRDLVDWGIVQRVRLPGDRKDRYRGIDDLYAMFARVVRERKRREIDPSTSAIKKCLEISATSEDSERAKIFHSRLSTLLVLFSMIDHVYDQVFANDDTFRRMMTMLDTDGD